MLIASLFFANQAWLVPALAIFGVAVVLVSLSYLRTPGPRGIRLGAAALKLLGIAALLLCLLEPMWSRPRAKPGANLFAVIADNSASMKLRGQGESSTRAEALQQVLSGEQNLWRAALAENFEVRNYLADSRLAATEDFRDLSFDGRSSALGGALKALSERYRGQPLAGVLLLTDGVAGDLEDADFSGFPPVYPVVFGAELPSRDLAITNTAVTQTSFEDAPVTVQAEISTTGFSGEEIVGKLSAAEPAQSGAVAEILQEQTLKITREGEKVVLRFQLRPEKTGVLFYRLRVMAKDEWSSPAAGTTEATLANNETVVAVDRGTGPHRVLYVSGRPNWEYKFLQRALKSDPQIDLVGLIRIAKREPKFEFRGRAGESSNPLFRGFGQQGAEEAERYDQPVFVRLNTMDEIELRGGFPKTEEELFKYRAVIFDDLEAEFFTADQMSLTQRFVSDRGGGLLMLGGMESFAEGKFSRTPIGDLLPIYLDGAPATQPGGEWRLMLTREGWLQPWARLRTSEVDDRRRLSDQPHFEVINRARETKPAATVVATVSDGRTELPALVTQRFGRGRSAALLVGDLWQSGLGDEALEKDLAKSWRQMVRWLVADVPERIDVRADLSSGSENVQLQIRARDAKYRPLDNANIGLKVWPLGASEPVTLNAEASPDEPGLYLANYVARESGGYRVEATVSDENSVSLGQAASGWTTDLASAEFRSLSPNRSLMETLAQKTGGAIVAAENLLTFTRDLPTRSMPVTEPWITPIWHTPAVFFFALACFCAEWGLRRWKGLA